MSGNKIVCVSPSSKDVPIIPADQGMTFFLQFYLINFTSIAHNRLAMSLCATVRLGQWYYTITNLCGKEYEC